MVSLLLAVIYLAFISLGLPDSLLGAGWPVMHGFFGVPLSYAGFVSMIVSAGTVTSSLLSERATRKLGTRYVTLFSVLLTALNTMNNDDPNSLVSRVQRVLSIEEVSHEVGSLTASQLQNKNYVFTAKNVLFNWGLLFGFIVLYALIGIIFLERVDHDKR